MPEITPSTMDENPGICTAINTESENRLNDKHIFPIQEALQWSNTPKRKYKTQIGCHLLQHVEHGKLYLKIKKKKTC
jgi:hypothetical protein